MRKMFLLILVSLSVLPTGIFGSDFLTKDLLKQLRSVDDSSILKVTESKYYLNADRIYIIDNGIYLDSDCFGVLALSNVMRDGEGLFTVDVYTIYMCDNCHRYYNSQPEQCDTCGGTSFTPINQLED